MLLLLLLIVLFVSGLMSLLVKDTAKFLSKAISGIGIIVASGLMAVIGFTSFDHEFNIPWIPFWNINFHLGIDWFSFCLSALTLIVAGLAIWIARPTFKIGSYYAAISWTAGSMVGLFLSADIFLFFIFWELALFPIYWIIVIHGNEQRISSALRFIFFTQISGLILLISVLALAYANFNATSILTFDYYQLTKTLLPKSTQHYLLLGFSLAFLIKLPSFPFHGWLPLLFTEAPVPIILVGLLVKTAIFGMVKFSWALFPEACTNLSLVMMCIGVFSIIYGAVLAFSQTNPKRLMAYGTLSHGGMLLIGVFCQSEAAFLGVFLLLIAQALSTAGTMMMLDRLYWSRLRVNLEQTGGLWRKSPQFSAVFFIILLAGIGFPTFGTFVGEWLILWGAFTTSPIISVLASLGIVLGVVYSLRLFQKLCLYQEKSETSSLCSEDLMPSEITVYSMVIILLLGLGLCPNLILERISLPIATGNHSRVVAP